MKNRKNPVARALNQINRPQTHKSVRDYRRQPKHRVRYEREFA